MKSLLVHNQLSINYYINLKMYLFVFLKKLIYKKHLKNKSFSGLRNMLKVIGGKQASSIIQTYFQAQRVKSIHYVIPIV